MESMMYRSMVEIILSVFMGNFSPQHQDVSLAITPAIFLTETYALLKMIPQPVLNPALETEPLLMDIANAIKEIMMPGLINASNVIIHGFFFFIFQFNFAIVLIRMEITTVAMQKMILIIV